MAPEHQHNLPGPTDEQTARIQDGLLAWYQANKRDLPWRGADAYGVWISEIMLQQTQVATVIPYYLRFMLRFPTVFNLASASVDDVLLHWAGLGYYARARNLHNAAGLIVGRHAGRIPDNIEQILKLPGIGVYTAGAILSIAYDRRFAAIDANVIRVLCRVFGIRGEPKSNPTQNEIRLIAERLVPAAGAGDFNQALMELGALVCESVDPNCELCPLLAQCAAGNTSNPAELPEYAPTIAATNLVHSCIVIRNETGELLVLQRPPHGLWGGLWEFPRVACKPGEAPIDAAKRAALEIAGIEIGELSKLTIVKHSVTRYRITLHTFVATVEGEKNTSYMSYKSHGSYLDAHLSENSTSLKWLPLEALLGLAFSSPQTQVLNAIAGSETHNGRI